jgi:flagellar hook protein FlgE
MAFNIGLSGIRAAATDLEVTGNNVANASTTGFKESRAEFADVFTTSILGTGTRPVGSGVIVDNVRQEFSQGNISGTENALDMAVDGTGFFVLNNGGSESYTRAGAFGLDKDGYVVANSGARLQGYEANDGGVVNGVLGDLQIVIGNQPPALTSRVTSILNLDASEEIKQELGQKMVTTGLAIASPDSGIADNTASIHATVGQPTTAGTRAFLTFPLAGAGMVSSTATPMFDVAGYAGGDTFTIDPNDGSGSQVITLAAVAAVPSSQDTFIDNLLGQVQTQLDTAFGNNEFNVTTSSGTAPYADPVQLIIERAGLDATIGQGITLGAVSTGTFDAVFGAVATTTLTAGVPGSNLFVGSSPVTADFRSIAGTSTTTRTVSTPPLTITALQPGSPAALLSTITPSNGVLTGVDYGTSPVTITVNYTDSLGATGTQNILLDTASFTAAGGIAAGNQATPTMDMVRLVIANEIAVNGAAFPGGVQGAVTAGGVSPAPLQFDGASNGSIISISSASSADLVAMGFTTTNRVAAGVSDILPNNVFRIQVTDSTGTSTSAAWDITIPASNYATLDGLAAAIQTEIDPLVGPTGVSGRVSVAAVGGQLVFTNTEVGNNFSVALTAHSFDVNAAPALTDLGFDAMSTFLGTDTIDRSNSFRISITVPAPDLEGRSGTTTITLDEEFRSVQQVAASINRQIGSLSTDAYVGVRAEATEITPNVVPPEYKLQLVATKEGEASVISISDFIANGADVTADEMYGLLQIDEDDTSLLTLGIEGVNNEYPAQKATLTDPDGVEVIINTDENAEANAIAAIYNRQVGVTASASSSATIPLTSYNNPSNNMTITLNGQILTASSLEEITEEINGYRTTTLTGFEASLEENGDLTIKNSIGRDIKIEISSPTVTDSIVVTGSANAGPVVLGGTSTADVAASVGGTIEFVLNQGYSLSAPVPAISGIFGALDASEFEDFVLNSFDPTDQDTYNHATSSTLYDSLGNDHIMTQFFVKEPLDLSRPNEENIWAMYVQIDGQDIGDPDSTLAFPANLDATPARYELFFNPDGTFDESATGDLHVTNWDPLDSDGAPTGSLRSLNVLEGGLPLTEPASNSNFQILLDGSTQFGSAFSVTEATQNGYSTGRLTGLEIDTDGLMFARFTNGQAQVLGQVALASFKNPEGLVPLGSTAWGESFESGGATVGSPRTGTFGNLRSSALEDSNVDLSEELVGLIIAQRNFQASAKTIETSDTVTQTIIQL